LIVLGVAWVMLAPSEGFALVSFKSLGIDQTTMEVTDPARLREMGMKTVRKGDRIVVTGTEDRRHQILNQRTGEKLIYPPAEEGAPRGAKRPGGSR
jgi:hypothetical protein